MIEVNAGESGFLARVAAPVLSAVFEGDAAVTGEGSIMHRPMNQLSDALAQAGVSCNGAMPLCLHGRLRPSEVRIDGKDGSQTVSGLMFAFPLLEKPSRIIVDNPKSLPYILLTRDVLASFGIRTDITEENGRLVIDIPVPQRYVIPESLPVNDGDWSGAANIMVAAAVCGDCTFRGLDMASAQADRAILDVLRSAGACVRVENDGGIRVRKSPLLPFVYDASDSPDLFPSLAVLASFCCGESRISGLDRLASKESDRAEAICALLSQAGTGWSRIGNTLAVKGYSLTSRMLDGNMPGNGKYPVFGDHRMAMAVMTMALIAHNGGIVPDNISCVSKSMPQFPELLAKAFNIR